MITGEESNCIMSHPLRTLMASDNCEEKITSIRRGEVFRKCICVYVCMHVCMYVCKHVNTFRFVAR